MALDNLTKDLFNLRKLIQVEFNDFGNRHLKHNKTIGNLFFDILKKMDVQFELPNTEEMVANKTYEFYLDYIDLNDLFLKFPLYSISNKLGTTEAHLGLRFIIVPLTARDLPYFRTLLWHPNEGFFRYQYLEKSLTLDNTINKIRHLDY